MARKKWAQLLGVDASAHAQQLAVSNNMTARRKLVAYQVDLYPEKEASPLHSPLSLSLPLYDSYDSSTPSGWLVESVRAFSSFPDKVVRGGGVVRGGRSMLAREKWAQLLGVDASAHAQQLALSNNMTAKPKLVAYQYQEVPQEVPKDQLALFEVADAIEFYPEKEASSLHSPLSLSSTLYDSYDSSTPSGWLVESVRAFSSFPDRGVQNRGVGVEACKVESCEVESCTELES